MQLDFDGGINTRPSFDPPLFPADRLDFPTETRAAAEETFTVRLTEAELDAYLKDLRPQEAQAFMDRSERVGDLVQVEETLHDYRLSYAVPGLYRRLIVEHCKYASHATLSDLFAEAAGGSLDRRRVLDIAAGSGESGFQLARNDARYVVGLDIHSQALEAAERDFPGVYKAYELGLAGDELIGLMMAHRVTDVFIAGGVNSNHAEALVQPAIDALPVGRLICLTATQHPPEGEVRMLDAFKDGTFRNVKIDTSLSRQVFHRLTLTEEGQQQPIFYDAIVARKVASA